MRLIDADKIEVENLEGVVMSFAQEVIDDTPTEDAELVIYARWEKLDSLEKFQDRYRCSKCGRIILIHPNSDELKEYPYCHCGAKMDEEGGDDNEYV